MTLKLVVVLVGLVLCLLATEAFPQTPTTQVEDTTNAIVKAGDAANKALRVNVVAGASGGGTVTQGAGAGAATNFWNFRLTDGTSFYQALTDTQLRASAVHTICDSGCTPGGSFADASAFSFGTTAVGVFAAVVDDTSTNTVAEDSAGAPRMSASRVLYVDLSKTAANATAVKVDGSAVTQPVSGTFFQATQPVSIAATVAVSGPLTDTQLRATPVPVSGTVTVTDGAGALNVIVDSGTTVVTQGTGTNLHAVIDSGSITANAGTNLNTSALALSATQTDRTQKTQLTDGTRDGTIKAASTAAAAADTSYVVALSPNSPLPAGANNIGDVDVLSFPDNEPFNLAQVAGATVQTGSGTAAGAQRIELANNGTGTIAAITTSVTPGTAAANLGKAEDGGHTTGDVGIAVLGVRVDPTTTATSSANSDYTAIAVDHVGAIAQGVHPGRFSCLVPLTTTATTQCQAAPAAGLRNYVTSLSCSNGAATVQGVDVVFGTGTNCGTGTTALTHKYQMGTNALTTSPFLVSTNYGPTTPLVPTAANAICVRPTAATAFGCTITGFVAP